MGSKLGQHFLCNPLVGKKIVEVLAPQKQENILEIGPGEGFLTALLLQRPVYVRAVEIDRSLVAKLEKKFKGKRIEIINADFLQVDIPSETDRICGNLPYQICGKILEKVLLSETRWKKAVFMLPLATALRAAALPGQSEYSRLSVLCRRVADVKLEFLVEKEDFVPPPEINSALVSLIKKESPPDKNFIRVVKGAFKYRRKKIRNSLSNYFSLPAGQVSKMLERCGIDPDKRAQEIEVEKFKLLVPEFVKNNIL
ncbi:MAG: 16S rRNA (adenine(1518)-N(6)/adenine(1519)-N(6))-dimethyltransferase RsmA [Elusimicrobiota bacterium]